MKLTGIGDTVEILTGGEVGGENRGVLVPIGMLQGIVGARGAIHRGQPVCSEQQQQQQWV